jgi:hypothetical protein
MAALSVPAAAQGASKARIYSCVDSSGKRITSDRIIPACLDKEQKVHASDGTVRAVVPPFMNGEERAAHEAKLRAAANEQAIQLETTRRDRQLMARYRNESEHGLARAEALEDVQRSLELSERRLRELGQELEPLAKQAESYQNRAIPTQLQRDLERNEASTQAQSSLRDNLVADRERIIQRYDAELARLRHLWAGAAPGSMGPLLALPAGGPTPSSATEPGSKASAER